MAANVPSSINPTPLAASISQAKPIGSPPVSKSVEPAAKIAQASVSPNAKHPRGSKLIELVTGVKVGIRVAHTVAVLDMTGDQTQYYPYLNHCDTCAWEGRYSNLDNAKLNARAHAGI